MRKLLIFFSYLQAFDLGLYCASEFKFNHPIEGYRWAITGLLFIMTIIGIIDTKKR
jgi:hypothetical protein